MFLENEAESFTLTWQQEKSNFADAVGSHHFVSQSLHKQIYKIYGMCHII